MSDRRREAQAQRERFQNNRGAPVSGQTAIDNRREAQAERDRFYQAKGPQETATSTEEVLIAEETATDSQNEEAVDGSQESIEESRDFKYPLTISKSYPARIIFRAVKLEGVDIAEKVGDLYKKGSSAFSELLGGVIDSFNPQEATTSSVADATVSPEQQEEIQQSENTNSSYFKSFENKSPGTTVGTVTLPLMRDLRYSDLAQYETANLGMVGGALEGALQGQSPFSGALSNGQLTSTASALAASVVAKGAGEVIGAAIGSSFGTAGAIVGASALGGTLEGLSPAVRSASRIASAPNQRTLFQQVGIRNFAFVFKMVANNYAEAEEVRNIVKFFRQELYPEKINLGESGVPLAYKFPNVFEIDIKNKWGNNPAFKIQRCYLRDVQTSFNSTASGMHFDGNFVEVDISLSFQEIVTLHKEKIRDGF